MSKKFGKLSNDSFFNEAEEEEEEKKFKKPQPPVSAIEMAETVDPNPVKEFDEVFSTFRVKLKGFNNPSIEHMTVIGDELEVVIKHMVPRIIKDGSEHPVDGESKKKLH